MDKIKILALSDSPLLNTGFSTITLNLMNRLHELDYDITYLGQAVPHAQPLNMIDSDKIFQSWDLTPTIENRKVPSVYLQDRTSFKFNLIGQASEGYCKDIIQPWIKQLKPDIYFTLLDTFMVYPWYLDFDFSPAKTIFYYPTDGEPFLPGIVCENILKKMNKAVAMSKHGQKQVLNYHKIQTDYIPHAIDTELFKPMTEEEKNQIKIKWGLHGKFVVGCVSRNQPRKMMDRTIKTFAKFAKDKDDVVLMLHADPYDKAAVFDMNGLIKELNIANKVLYTGVKYFYGFTYEQMKEVYNLMDCFCLLTSGEGFGIPIIEALSCEIPCIVTDYTTGYELIVEDGECGELVKLVGTETYNRYGDKNILLNTLTGSWNVERGIADITDGANKLNKLYYDRSLCRTYGKTGRRKVQKFYDWNGIILQWNNLIRGMLND